MKFLIKLNSIDTAYRDIGNLQSNITMAMTITVPTSTTTTL